MQQTVHVVLVEDDDVDVEAIQRCFRSHQLANPISVFGNGLEALQALTGPLGRELTDCPYIILLDLNMPRMGGIEFLDHLRRLPALHRSIVFALTTSDAEQDMGAAYDRQIAGYMVKSSLGPGYAGLYDMLDTYWRTITFPPRVDLGTTTTPSCSTDAS